MGFNSGFKGLKCDAPYCPVLVIKDRGVQNNSLHLHAHIDYTFPQSVRMLSLVQTTNYPHPTTDSFINILFNFS